MRVGITGHQTLEGDDVWDWVGIELCKEVHKLGLPIMGVTLLAPGVDQLFATVILGCGGNLQVIVPFYGYRKVLSEKEQLAYDNLMAAASQVISLEGLESDDASYMQAGMQLVDSVELLLAVWDGLPAQGLGGTADVFHYAEYCRLPIVHLNPVSQQIHRISGA